MLKVHMTTQHGQDNDSNLPQIQLVDKTSDQSNAEHLHYTRPHQLVHPSEPDQTAINLSNTIFDPTTNTPNIHPTSPNINLIPA